MAQLFDDILGRKPQATKKPPKGGANKPIKNTNPVTNEPIRMDKIDYNIKEEEAYAIREDEHIISDYAHHIVMGEILNSPRFKTRSRFR